MFTLAFLFLPTLSLFVGAFQTGQGGFTLDNVLALGQPFILRAYWVTIQISAVTAVLWGFFGFLLAYAIVLGGLPRWTRTALLTFSGVASNFAGVPLAFAFIATLGRVGLITTLLKEFFGFNIYDQGFNLYSFIGLTLTYLYFQFP